MIKFSSSNISKSYGNKDLESTNAISRSSYNKQYPSSLFLSKNLDFHLLDLPIQPKLKINQPNDKYEQEADRIADRVVDQKGTEIIDNHGIIGLHRKPLAKEISSLRSSGIQRECSQCKDEEEERMIQRKGDSISGSNVSQKFQTQLRSTESSGKSLDQKTMKSMNSHFGIDFSKVKIHDNTRSSELSQQINAKAFTLGNNIYFNRGEYQPNTILGQRLLAHELTHTLQQGSNNHIRREEGITEYRNTVSGSNQDPNTNIWDANVNREEFIPANGTQARRSLGSINGIRITFNPNEGQCMVTLPSKLKFEHPNSSNYPLCGEDHGTPVPPNLPSDQFNDIKERYIRLTNERLNGWYAVRISDCEHACADQYIPIRVHVEEVSSGEDAIVVIANKAGRSCASPNQITLHAQEPGGGEGITDSRIAHESGHASLGFRDEYPVSRGNANEESVRRDFTLAGSTSDFHNWSMLHERHFDFVPDFLESILPGCNAELRELNRPDASGMFNIHLGLSSYQGLSFYAGIGVDVAAPITRDRDFQLFLGAHSHIMINLIDVDRTAFLLGARLGFMNTVNLSEGGFQWGGFGELGGGTFAASPTGSRYEEAIRYGSPYYLFGGGLGYSGSPSNGRINSFRAEAGFGSAFITPDSLDGIENNQWFQAGLSYMLQWH